MQYYFVINGQKQGPYTKDIILQLIKTNVVDYNTLAWGNDMTSWLAVKDIPALQEILNYNHSLNVSSIPTPPPIPNHMNVQQNQLLPINLTPVNQSLVYPNQNYTQYPMDVNQNQLQLQNLQLQQQLQHIQQMQQIQKVNMTLEPQFAPPKNPFFALFLSFFIIGAGQIYNADGRKGAIMLLIAIVLVPLSAGVLWLPLAIWSMIDAYSAAKATQERW